MYTYFANDDQVTLINISNGNRVTMYEQDKQFDKFKEFIIAGDYEAAEKLDVKLLVTNFTAGAVTVVDGVGSIKVGSQDYPLHNSIVKRIMKMSADGFGVTPLINFLTNLYNNPSKSAVDELFLFIDNNELPITTDGHFIAYKIVRNDYKDIYTGKMDNSVGQVVSMPRFSVDDRRYNTCSAGLHFCSNGYLASYSSYDINTDRCMLLKINPADVVSIPDDYNNAKGRTCRYEVVGEVDEKNWRQNLSKRDYTSASVVNDVGVEHNEDTKSIEEILADYDFVFDFDDMNWSDDAGNIVSTYYVSGVTGIPVTSLTEYENYKGNEI